MKIYPMVSMEMDDEEKEDFTSPMPCPTPDYPYGLKICLTQDEFKKLNIDPSEAFVGGIVHIHALARITSVSISDDAATSYSDGGPRCRVEFQIEDMCLESEDEENQEYD